VVATPDALQALAESDESALAFLVRHSSGDWGTVCAEDAASNDDAIDTDGRILSSYELKSGVTIWIITEWDRSVTTILLPSDY
jgi:hypothetical protein